MKSFKSRFVFMAVLGLLGVANGATEQPNILWLIAEDMSTQLGCYGDLDALTPQLNHFATEAIRYGNAFSLSPACAPARTTLVTGMSPTTLGANQMRSAVTSPQALRLLPWILQEKGYFCAVNKTDYNLDAGYDKNKTGGFPDGWDSGIPGEMFFADKSFPEDIASTWRKRKSGQPFFLMATLARTHESRYGFLQDPNDYHRSYCRQLTPEQFQNRAAIHLPPYMSDTTASREYWAQYQEAITDMDHLVGEVLDLLKSDGLDENTIVFFFGDNGAGVFGTKGYLTDQGLHVPLMVRVPQTLRSPAAPQHGGVEKRLVSFEDFAPTVLSLIGEPVPPMMQGKPFLGLEPAAPRKLSFGFRDRIDSQVTMLRSVRDERYAYVRNFLPHRNLSARLFTEMSAPEFCVETEKLGHADKLPAGILKTAYNLARPSEELYDLQSDPWELHNLATDEQYRPQLERLRKALIDHIVQTGDLGLLPEGEMLRLSGGGAPFDMAQDTATFPISRLLEAADLIRQPPPDAEKEFVRRLGDGNAAIRWWAVQGLMRIDGKSTEALAGLERLSREDESPDVRIASAEALCRAGRVDAGLEVLLKTIKDRQDPLEMMAALDALIQIGDQAKPGASLAKGIIENPPRFKGANAKKIVPAMMFSCGWLCEEFGETVDYGKDTPWWVKRMQHILELQK
ncbi:MAG: sulfatase-like hydrolase/transferase [Kiritimatiellales bacterium]|nr:sulfatase-like hydrolase/transferase [Kiritimatiellales bacterium]